MKRLESVSCRLKKHGLKLKGRKCEFFRREIKYLGFIVSEEGIKTDQEKVKAVRNWPKIKNVRGIFHILLQEVRTRLC